MKSLRSVYLLGGSVRRSPLTAALGRSAIDLPIDPDRSVLGAWQSHVGDLAQRNGSDSLALRVILDRTAPEPAPRQSPFGVELSIERDPIEFRGTAGVLKDVTSELSDDELILVGNASQLLLRPLATLVDALADEAADFVALSHADGTPSGLMLLRRACLTLIPDIGFIDMKEQAIPMIAKDFTVRIIEHPERTGVPMRTCAEYVSALQFYHRRNVGSAAENDPFAEEWRSSFAIVEKGAEVGQDVVIHDSVVLAGARVEEQAFLVRSIVGSMGTIRGHQTVVNQVVSAGVRESL